MSNLTPIIKDSFLQFSGAVLQSRALSDARDNMKPSARQILYCMYTDGLYITNPLKKLLKQLVALLEYIFTAILLLRALLCVRRSLLHTDIHL